jgi:hypothetical protein
MKLIYFCLFSLASAYKYLQCNESQHSYFYAERELFGVASHETPLFNKGDFEEIQYIPTTCIGETSCVETKTAKYLYNFIDKPIPPSKAIHIPFVTQILNVATDIIWKVTGWTKRTYYDEQYWYYENPSTDNVAVYFHGLNGMNALENMYLLRHLTTQANVYVSLYPHTFIQSNRYNHTYSEHINNVIDFMKNELYGKTVTLVGNSYGSIRVTTICKRYDCSHISKIVLTDAINVNVPFQIFKILLYGVFLENEQTGTYNKSITVQTLKHEKHYHHFLNSVDWYEWNIDSYFMNMYRNNLVLIMGDYDKFVRVNKTSYAMTQLCRVIYTPTRHGMVLFTDVLDGITLF